MKIIKLVKENFISTIIVFLLIYLIFDVIARNQYSYKFNEIHESLKTNFDEQNLVEASRYAKLLIEYDNSKRPSIFYSINFKLKQWNYGNGIHSAHTVLGLNALNQNDILTASKHLLASSLISGSPQLDTFGPSMLLAKKLSAIGEHEVVFEYLKNCENFWDNTRLENWRRTLANNRMPQFPQKNMRLL